MKVQQLAAITSFLALSMISSVVFAAPVLQLGISEGSYDKQDKTVITTERNFTLNAFGLSTNKNVSTDTTFYLSVAIKAAEGFDAANFGSFKMNQTTYTFSDMVFGNPPFDSTDGYDKGDLKNNGIFDTWFSQTAFQFSATQKTGHVDTKKTPGFDPNSKGSKYFFESFDFDTAGLLNGYNLYFSLYSTKTGKNGDIDIKTFAPFTRDAATAYTTSSARYAAAPEPASLALFAIAFAGLGLSRKNNTGA